MLVWKYLGLDGAMDVKTEHQHFGVILSVQDSGPILNNFLLHLFPLKSNPGTVYQTTSILPTAD